MSTLYANDCPTMTCEPAEDSVQVLERNLSEILDSINSIACDIDVFVVGCQKDPKAPCTKIDRDSLMSSLKCDIDLAISAFNTLRNIAKNLGM